MINCYINEESFYIIGQDIEVFSSYELSETDDLYKIYVGCIYLLPHLRGSSDNIILYNNTRFVDDLSGITEPLSPAFKEGFRIIKGMTSSLHGVVLYKKISKTQLNQILANAKLKMLNPNARETVIKLTEANIEKRHKSRVQKLKDYFFGDKNG